MFRLDVIGMSAILSLKENHMKELKERQATYVDELLKELEEKVASLFAEVFTNYENPDYADMRGLIINDSSTKKTRAFVANVFIPTLVELVKKHENLKCSVEDKNKNIFVIKTNNEAFRIAVRVRFKEVNLSDSYTRKRAMNKASIQKYGETLDRFYECVATYSTTVKTVKNDNKRSDADLKGLAKAIGDSSLSSQFYNPDYVTKKIFCNTNIKMIKIF